MHSTKHISSPKLDKTVEETENRSLASDELDEVLDIPQRMKRGQILKRNKVKLERGRELAKRRPADAKKIRKQAFAQARQIVRTRFAGKYGASYSELTPSAKIQVDKMIDNKKKLIVKLAQRLIPKVKRKNQQRLQSFMAGSPLKENVLVNAMFEEAFKDEDQDQNKDTNKKTKGSFIKILGRFDSKTNNALTKKAEKAGMCVETLGRIYARGLKAWTEDTGVSPEQFAFSRVNSFISKGKTYFTEDNDLAESELPSAHKDILAKYGVKPDKYLFHKNKVEDVRKHITAGDKFDMAAMKEKIHPKYHDLYQHGIWGGTMSASFLKGVKKLKEELTENTKPFTIDVVLSKKGGVPITRRVTIQARSSQEAHALAKQRARQKYAADKIHDTHHVTEAVDLDTHMKRHDAVMKRYGGELQHLTKQLPGKNVTNGYVVGHDPKKAGHVMLRAHVPQGSRSKNNDEYKDHSVPAKHLTTDYKKAWYMKESYDYDKIKTKTTEDDWKRDVAHFHKKSPETREKIIKKWGERGNYFLTKHVGMKEETLQEAKSLAKGISHVGKIVFDKRTGKTGQVYGSYTDGSHNILWKGSKEPSRHDYWEVKQHIRIPTSKEDYKKLKEEILQEARPVTQALRDAQANMKDLRNGGVERKRREAAWKKQDADKKKKEISDHKEAMAYHAKLHDMHKQDYNEKEELAQDIYNGHHWKDYGVQDQVHARGIASELEYEAEKHWKKVEHHKKQHDYHRDMVSILTNKDHKGMIKEETLTEDMFPSRKKDHSANLKNHPKGSTRFINLGRHKDRNIDPNYHNRAIKVSVTNHHLLKYGAHIEVKPHKDQIGFNHDARIWTSKDHLHHNETDAIADKKKGYHPDNLPIIKRAMEEESLQELSKKTLKNYSKMADGQLAGDDIHPSLQHNQGKEDKVRKFMNRTIGSQLAKDKIEGNNFARVSAGDRSHVRKQEIMRKIIESGNVQNDPAKREVGTDSSVDAFVKDTPGMKVDKKILIKKLHEGKMKEVAFDLENMDHGNFKKKYNKSKDQMKQALQKEEVRTADKEPVVIPAHKDQYNNDIQAKTVMRKKQKKIISSGNVHDGEPR